MVLRHLADPECFHLKDNHCSVESKNGLSSRKWMTLDSFTPNIQKMNIQIIHRGRFSILTAWCKKLPPPQKKK